MPEYSDLFVTLPLTIYDDALRHCERRRAFGVSELLTPGCHDITGFGNPAEGGFNRSFLVAMRNGLKLVARIPYPVKKPKFLVIASEVATMDFLRSHGIPMPIG
ncbi:hypothetical protein N7499_003252 [Penicillium canescens]|uniref:Uncharacterized protein n=1 Tax=Penicillium canescens TaxID=5083 RepID=A0AAD6I5K1_PENCN|nr:uncharacterized protein N7446_014014 [Penicillium canescens]KAJ6018553.1 hypothetical protein N7522_002017 [Penicillium canescens]KAJ6034159.1 hypothetical protein N7460_009976 [Penicillium canescens]KAJ6039266.1 hypothetical protein N7446_014014 [Penicillium canescens]KAJ6066115.1 hypothetical protein N7444_000244 [Penicillium canescens]KAJ6091101.1 hypothetical protein N7499_003252 [Penicillium canescens]